MTKKPQKNSSAAAISDDERLQEGAGSSHSSEPAPDPSGMNGPDGTNTTTPSASGDAAGTVTAVPVNRLGEEPTEANPAEAGAPSIPGIPPEVEASASGAVGVDFQWSSQGEGPGGAGAAAGSAGALPGGKRQFHVAGAYRRGGKRHAGGWQMLTAQAHADLAEAGLVDRGWDAAEPAAG